MLNLFRFKPNNVISPPPKKDAPTITPLPTTHHKDAPTTTPLPTTHHKEINIDDMTKYIDDNDVEVDYNKISSNINQEIERINIIITANIAKLRKSYNLDLVRINLDLAAYVNQMKLLEKKIKDKVNSLEKNSEIKQSTDKKISENEYNQLIKKYDDEITSFETELKEYRKNYISAKFHQKAELDKQISILEGKIVLNNLNIQLLQGKFYGTGPTIPSRGGSIEYISKNEIKYLKYKKKYIQLKNTIIP